MRSHRLGGLLAALALAALLGTSLSGEEFERGIYGSPSYSQSTAVWEDFGMLGINRVYNRRSNAAPSQLGAFLGRLHNYGMKAILEKPGWDWPYSPPNNVPYLVKHYSQGQYKELQVEWDQDEAQSQPNNTGYYNFQQYIGEPETPQGTSDPCWKVDPDSHNAGEILKGPYDVTNPIAYTLMWEPEFNYYSVYDYDERGRTFQHRVRALADLSGHNPNEAVFRLCLDYRHTGTFALEAIDSVTFTVGDFARSMSFDTLEFSSRLDTSDHVRGFGYRVYWYGTVPLWIDWIAYMDMEQAHSPLVTCR